MYLRVGEANPPTPLVQTSFDDRNAVVSPDGRWLAYETNSSGRFEVYVRPFPGTDSGQWQVSNEGGVQPQWTRDGHELFYFAPDGALMRVPVEARDATWNAGKPVKALEGRYYTGGDNARLIGRQYDISPDGERFLMIKPPASGQGVASPIVVLNWQEELKRLVPVR
jgi:WD40-like Beta Propeller Repeat